MPESAPTPLTLQNFNPGWVPAMIAIVACLSTMGSTYFDSQETKSRVKDLEMWRATKDVADAQMRIDISYIKDGIRELRDKPPPAVQVYTVQPSPSAPVSLPQVRASPP